MNDRHDPLENGSTRWWIMAFVSVMLFGNYYVYDAIGPLAETLQRELGFSDTELGALNAIYSLPNVFMVLIGGLLIDRYGPGRVALWTTGICLLGAVLTASRGEFFTMAAGRLFFGIGAETMIVATTAALAMWFRSSHLALAMALSLSIARGGSYAADVSPVWASSFYEQGWQAPLWLAAGMALLSFVAAILYWAREHKGVPPALAADGGPPDRIVWRDVLRFDRSYWYVVALCVLFYSVIFPFRSTFAIKYFQHAHGLALEDAATINSYVFLAAVFITPIFGALVDRIGRRALFMVFGALLLPLSFLALLATDWGLWVTSVLLGVSFSLIPAVLWPAVALIVPAARLGTAYGLMTMIQAIGLTAANLIAGWLNDVAGASAENPTGYVPMLIFFGATALAAFVFAFLLLRRETGPEGHGLETAKHTDARPMAGPV
jgi:MFS family permease